MTVVKSVLIHGEMLNIFFMILVCYFPADPFPEEAGISPELQGPEQWKNMLIVVEKVMVSLLSSWNNVCSLLPCPLGELEAQQLQAFAVCFVALENTNWPSFYQQRVR